ncbi:MAG: sulfonate ABC transporter [Candidatus Bathyarchaeia archaeon]
MVKSKCPVCLVEFDLPDDVLLGEIVTCPECGSELEVKEAKGSEVELKEVVMEKEDWGE